MFCSARKGLKSKCCVRKGLQSLRRSLPEQEDRRAEASTAAPEDS